MPISHLTTYRFWLSIGGLGICEFIMNIIGYSQPKSLINQLVWITILIEHFFEVILINMYWWRQHDLVWWSKVALAFSSGFPLFLLILWISFVFLKTLILVPKLLPLDGSKGMLFYQDSPRCHFQIFEKKDAVVGLFCCCCSVAWLFVCLFLILFLDKFQ